MDGKIPRPVATAKPAHAGGSPHTAPAMSFGVAAKPTGLDLGLYGVTKSSSEAKSVLDLPTAYQAAFACDGGVL